MNEYAGYAFAALFGGLGALCIVNNWLILLGGLFCHDRRAVSFVPIIGPGFGMVGCLAYPSADVRVLAWVPWVLDPMLLIIALACVLHPISRAVGRPSPFDPEPPRDRT